MKLLDDWKRIAAKAWSIKFMALSVLLTALEVMVGLTKPDGVPTVLFAVLAGIVGLGAMIARVLAQKEVTHDASTT